MIFSHLFNLQLTSCRNLKTGKCRSNHPVNARFRKRALDSCVVSVPFSRLIKCPQRSDNQRNYNACCSWHDNKKEIYEEKVFAQQEEATSRNIKVKVCPLSKAVKESTNKI